MIKLSLSIRSTTDKRHQHLQQHFPKGFRLFKKPVLITQTKLHI